MGHRRCGAQGVDGHAKVTHEAAIGSVNKKLVETLISPGRDEAVDVRVQFIVIFHLPFDVMKSFFGHIH